MNRSARKVLVLVFTQKTDSAFGNRLWFLFKNWTAGVEN